MDWPPASECRGGKRLLVELTTDKAILEAKVEQLELQLANQSSADGVGGEGESTVIAELKTQVEDAQASLLVLQEHIDELEAEKQERQQQQQQQSGEESTTALENDAPESNLPAEEGTHQGTIDLSLIHISEPTRH